MTQKNWLKITFTCDPVVVEPLCDFLLGVIGAGVETGARDEIGYGIINCYVEDSDVNKESAEHIIQKISIYLQDLTDVFAVAMPTFFVETLEEEDWGKNWKEHFKPFAIIPGLIISPTWEKFEASPGEKVISMDPGMAFGTGHHATTSLSLKLLHSVIDTNRNVAVLDIGTGTGILGMASVHFGAASVLGIDNDPDAVSIAAENISRNGMQTYMQVSQKPLAALQGRFSVVVANIVHDVLIEMADDIERVTVDGGILVLSGLLHGDQTEKITHLYSEHGFKLQEELTQLEWSALRFEK